MPPDLLQELKKEFRISTGKITDSVNDLGVKIGSMDTSIQNIEKTLDKHDERITETREAQLKCEAAGGWKGLNREMRDAKKAIANPGTAPVAFTDRTNGAILKKLFGRYGHWLIIALLAIGFYLGSGGDEEKTLQVLRNLREIGLKVEKIEKIKTEPIRVPVPVSAECVSEETP